MKTVRALVPLAVVLVVVGALLWWLLDRGSAAGPWLVAAILCAHGWVHLVFLLPASAATSSDRAVDNPFDLDRSWLISRGASRRLVRSVGTALAILTFVAFAAAGLAVLGWLLPAGWWDGLVAAGVVASTALLVLSYAATLVLGFVINAGLLTLAVQTAWDVAR
jgi:hypothetical protein